MQLTTRIADWADGREAVLAREAAEGASSRWADEIQSFDDEAVRIVNDVRPVIEAVEALMALRPDMWLDIAERFCCNEADAIAKVFRATNRDELADEFLTVHSIEDHEPEDRHQHLRPKGDDQ